MVPYVSAHQVLVTQNDLITILSEANPLTNSLSQLAQQSIQQLGIYNVVIHTTFRFTIYMHISVQVHCNVNHSPTSPLFSS